MEIRPITFKQACEFINEQHRHHKSTVGCKFNVGLFEDKKMVGCAVCGRPVSRYLDDGLTLEINRLCTDGTKMPVLCFTVHAVVLQRKWDIRRLLLIFWNLKTEQV